jgi:hypothetical protein
MVNESISSEVTPKPGNLLNIMKHFNVDFISNEAEREVWSIGPVWP